MGRFKKGNIPWNKGGGDSLGTIKVINFKDGTRRMIKVRTGTSHNYMMYSRYIMEQELGRDLLPSELVHHKNEDKLDDRPENLEVKTFSKHISEHRKGKIPIAGIKAAQETYRKRREKWIPKIKEMMNKDYSIRQMIKEIPLERNTTTKIVRELLVKTNYQIEKDKYYKQKRKKWKDKILELRKQGLSYPKIAEQVPFSRITIGKIIRGELNE